MLYASGGNEHILDCHRTFKERQRTDEIFDPRRSGFPIDHSAAHLDPTFMALIASPDDRLSRSVCGLIFGRHAGRGFKRSQTWMG